MGYRALDKLSGIFIVSGLMVAELMVLAGCSPAGERGTVAPTASRPTSAAIAAQADQATETVPPTEPPPTAVPTRMTSPIPTPVPSPIRLPPPPSGGSKLGVHGIWSDGIVGFAQVLAEADTPFRVVKAVDDLGWLKDVKRVSPGTVTVGRLTHEHEGAGLVNDPGTDLDWYAGVLMAPILSQVEADPALREGVDYWELTNEPLGGGTPAEVYRRLAQVTMRAMELAEGSGLRLAIFGFSAGTPEWADMLALVETGVFAQALAGGHILALHEGVFGEDPIDKWWNVHNVDGEGQPTTAETGVTAPGGWIPGGPVLEGAGALCLRYRFLYRLLEERGEVVPLFVSEFYAGGGYDPARKGEVVARMRWYDFQVSADDYLLGFGPFTLGPVKGWAHQDYGPFYEGQDGFVAYMMGGAP